MNWLGSDGAYDRMYSRKLLRNVANIVPHLLEVEYLQIFAIFKV